MKCDIPYCFYGGNREAILCKDREVILSGPAETGKTLAMLWLVHTLAYKYPGAHFAIIRKKKVDLTGTVIRTFKRDYIDAGFAPGVTWYGGEYPQWYDYPTSSRIWLGGIDDPGKTLSAERDLVYVNQAEELSLSDWEYLTRCVTGRGAVMPYTRLVGDCNPSSHTHWILARERAGKLTKFDTTHRDNPVLWDRERGEWTAQGKRSLETLANMTGTRRQRLFLGLWAVPEGSIYDVFEADIGEYGEKRHVVKSFPIPQAWPRAVGIDPFGAQIAAVWLAFDPASGILNVYREYCEPFGLTTEGHASNILREARNEPVFAWVCGGPSERAWRLEWRAAGIPVIEPPVKDVWVGIDRVYQLLREFRLVIHDNCLGLISEIGDYRRKIGRDGVPGEAIENKEAYHCLIGDTKVLTIYGDVPIKDVRANDIVLTRKGWRRVTAAACTNESANVYRVTFSDGRTLTGTGEHPVWIDGKGYTRLHSLRYDDIIVTPKQIMEVLQWKEKQLSMLGAHGDAIQMHQTGQIVHTSQLHLMTEMCKDLCTCIASFGKNTMVLFQMVALFITRMATHPIMTFRTLRCLHISNMLKRIGRQKEVSNQESISIASDTWHQNGTDHKKGESGIASLASYPGRVRNQLKGFVLGAAKDLKRLLTGITFGFARTIVNLLLDGHLGLMILSAYASPAAMSSSTTSMLIGTFVHAPVQKGFKGEESEQQALAHIAGRSLSTVRIGSASIVQGNAKTAHSAIRVVKIERLENEVPVYNLDVEDAHEFFANGILVHNCLDALRYVIAWLTEPKETSEVTRLPWMRIV